MNEYIAIGIYMVSGFVAAISQLILKLVALKTNGKSGLRQWLDGRIIVSYGMLISTVFFNMIAMRYMPYKYAPILSSLSYVFVLILGKFILHETIGRKKFWGILCIFLGMVVFYID